MENLVIALLVGMLLLLMLSVVVLLLLFDFNLGLELWCDLKDNLDDLRKKGGK